MKPNHLRGALFVAAASLFATGAFAQNPQAAAPAKANAADKVEKAAEKAAEKTADKAEKTAEKIADKLEKAGDKAKSGDDRAARRTKEHDAQREKLKSVLKGPMHEPLRLELRRHAERLARLERIKAVAQTEKDTATADKATALIGKENARHEAWMTKNAAGGSTATAPAPTVVAPTAANAGGAK